MGMNSMRKSKERTKRRQRNGYKGKAAVKKKIRGIQRKREKNKNQYRKNIEQKSNCKNVRFETTNRD